MLVDQGRYFGDTFATLCAMSNVDVKGTGVGAHNSLGLGERYHQPLRQTYRKIMSENPQSSHERALAAAVKAMNDTLGPEGLFRSVFMFGEFSRALTKSETPSERPILEERASVAQSARKKMGKIMAEKRIRRALHRRTPSASDRFYQPGDKVLVSRERIANHRIGEWLGPFRVIETDESRKLLFVQVEKIGAARPFNVIRVSITSRQILKNRLRLIWLTLS